MEFIGKNDAFYNYIFSTREVLPFWSRICNIFSAILFQCHSLDNLSFSYFRLCLKSFYQWQNDMCDTYKAIASNLLCIYGQYRKVQVSFLLNILNRFLAWEDDAESIHEEHRTLRCPPSIAHCSHFDLYLS